MVIAFFFLGCSFAGVHKTSKDEYVKITILHTNDTHSRIDGFATNDPKLGGLGGFAKRAALIKKIRSQEKNVLLFDSGDIFQGSPYFNFWGGELEFKLMSQMGYDAATIGNHEFDNGIDGFAKTLPFAKFPFLNCNYDFSKTVLKDKIQPYKIFEIQGIKIGVFGIGVELEGLVNKQQYGEIIYHNAYHKAAEISHLLKKDLNCDLIICLSHLGAFCDESKYCDVELAKQSKNIDLILGGHSHTQIDKPFKYVNSDGKEVIICQVGWAGIKLGRIDYYFNIKKGIKFSENYTTKIIKNQV